MQVKSIAEWEHSAILSTFVKVPFVMKIFVLSILNGRLRQGLLYVGLCSNSECGMQNAVVLNRLPISCAEFSSSTRKKFQNSRLLISSAAIIARCF